jgi:ribosomal protein S27E
MSMIKLIDGILNRFGYKVIKNVGHVYFHLHQIYEEPGDTEQLKCSNCGDMEFFVGQGSYFTVAKCMKCGHEECIHDG